MKTLVIKLLLRLLESRAPQWYNGIKDEKRKVWLLEQFENDGMREYFKWRDITILKTLGTGVPQKQYWMLVGQRIELLKLIGYAKEEYDKETKRKDKRIKDRKEEDKEIE